MKCLGLGLLVACGAVAACAAESDSYRGARLQPAALAVSDRVAVYRAALAGAFGLDDPTLWLLLDPTYLPRSAGLAGGDVMPAEVASALRSSGLIKGRCRVQLRKTPVPLVCEADRAGYVVRFSEPFAVHADTVQVHVVAQQYALATGPRAERLLFERAYYVARGASGWRAVREARLRQP